MKTIGIIAEYYTSSDYKPTKILAEAEKIVEKYGDKLKSTILKIAHHGSNTSSIESFESNEKYDIIICTHAFPYFPNKQEMIKKMAGLCNKKGQVIIVNSSTNSLKDLIINFFLKATTSKAKYLSIDEMKKLFKNAKLKVKKIEVRKSKKCLKVITN